MDWSQYVRSITEGTTQVDIAKRAGIDQTTISRWLNGAPRRAITATNVAKLARAFGRPVLEAYVAAGLITESEARVRVVKTLDRFSVDELLSEIARRAGSKSAS